MPIDPQDILVGRRTEAASPAFVGPLPQAQSVRATDPSDRAAMAAVLSDFSADTRIPTVALATVAEILTRVYGLASSGKSSESPPEPA